MKLQEFILDERLEHPIDVVINAKVLEISEGEVKLEVSGKQQILLADTVVFALGRKPNDALAKTLREKMPAEVYVIGDCRKAKSIGDATEQGAYVARQIP